MQSGVRLERRTPDLIGPQEKVRPLRDHILVRPLPWEPSKTIAISGSERKPLRGTVVAVGPGHYPKRYSPDRSKTWDSKTFQRTQVRVGDVVELGSLNGYSYQYDFPQVLIGTEVHIICREADVCGVVEEDESDWQDAKGKWHRYRCGLNPDPYAMKHLVNYCTCHGRS